MKYGEPDTWGHRADLCVEQVALLGQHVASMLEVGTTLGVSGPMGVGKTTFLRWVIQTLCPQVDYVPSPSFPLLLPYQGLKGPVTHMDLSRLRGVSVEDIRALGIEEMLEQSICLVEWPEQLQGLGGFHAYLQCTMDFVADPQRRTVVLTREFPHGLCRRCL